MISAARRRAVRLVSNTIEGGYPSWASALNNALSDTVRPIHIRSDGYDDEGAVLGIPGDYVILESVISSFVNVGRIELSGVSTLTLTKVSIGRLCAATVEGIDNVTVKRGTVIYSNPTVETIDFTVGGANNPPSVNTLVLNGIQATTVLMNASEGVFGDNGGNGVSAPGTNGTNGLDEDMYTPPTSGGNGGNGGVATAGEDGSSGFSGSSAGGKVMAYNCSLTTVKIHGSKGGDGGDGGNGGAAPGGNGGVGGDSYTPGVLPGNGGNGGDGGNGGNGGNGGFGGNGSPNTNPSQSVFSNCSISQLLVTAPGGFGGDGGQGGSAPGGNGGPGGINFIDISHGNGGIGGNNGSNGLNGNSGGSGSNGASQSFSNTGSTISVVI